MLNADGLIELSATSAVTLKPYKPRPFKAVEYITEQELNAGVGGTAIVDIELYKNYYLIGFKFTNGKYLALEAPFNERLLSWIMHNYRTVGFNSIKYDLAIIWYSYLTQDCRDLQQLSNALIFENLFPAQAAKDFGFQIHKTSHVDLIAVAPLVGSLKLYGARLHAKRIQDLPYPIDIDLTDEQKTVVKNYNINDLDSTELMMNNLLEQLKLRADLSIQYRTDLMSKSDAQIAESVIGYEIKQLTGTWPKRPEITSSDSHNFQIPSNLFFQTEKLKQVLDKISKIKFSIEENGRLAPSDLDGFKIQIGNSVYRMGRGGLHSSEKCQVIKKDENNIIKDIDVASYYPAIVLNLGLFPKHIGKVFLTVYRMLRDRRISAKKALQIAISECLKITINGTFGKTGSPYSFLYAPEMTIQITVGGQLYLLMKIEILELNGIPVVSANTDGIIVLCPKDKLELLKSLTKQWEQITGFETEETLYEAIYSRDVNAYLAVKKGKDGLEFKGKNDYYDPWRGKTAKDGYWRFQKNPTHQICVEAIERLIAEGKSIEETITECKDITKFVCVKNVTGGAHKDYEYLGKVVRWIYAKDAVGTINYIKSNNKVPETDGAMPLMDLPDTFPENLNYAWYVAKSKEMLEDIGYIRRQEQIKFF